MKKRLSSLIALILISLPVLAQTPQERIGQVQQITPEDQYFMRPSWSPDGQSLAFTTRNHDGIWVLDLATAEITHAIKKPGSGYQFAWSPDGSQIAYRARIVENRRSRHYIEVYEMASGEVRLIQSARFIGTPYWGRDSRSLYFVSGNELVRSEPLQAPGPSLEKPGSDQKEQIAFVLNQKLHISEVSDTLRQEGPVLEKRILNPSLSPGGDRVVYEEVGGDIIVQDLETLKKTSLGEGHRPKWSPDGNWVCFMITQDDGHEYLASEIWVVGADGKDRFALTDTKDKIEMNPEWSPDGRTIAFDERRTGVILVAEIQLQ